MFEELTNKVNIYFTKLDKQLTCFSFNINEHTFVESRRDSIMKLYDYYRPEYEILQFYSIDNKCDFNDSLLIPEILLGKPFSTTIKVNNMTIELPGNNTNATEPFPLESQDIKDNIVKRSMNYLNNTKDETKSTVGLNNDFVDKNIEMEFSNCDDNTSSYISPKRTNKRSTENDDESKNVNINAKMIDQESKLEGNSTDTFTNLGFIDTETDLDFSNCSDNIPDYIIPPNNGYQNINGQTNHYQKNENANKKTVFKRNTDEDTGKSSKNVSKCKANIPHYSAKVTPTNGNKKHV